ncbi:MAG: GMC family oxidoreductase N-terminal domain-containing protein, partial [Gammaproteobacteria bacterium]
MNRNQDFDYIVVGAGSAGGFLTLRLSENPDVRVLLLEAGINADHWSIRMPAASRNNYTGGPRNWCFETEPEPYMNNRRLFQPRGKSLGGSSSLNGMVYVRGHARDFDGWAESGAHGWAYRDVLPYFRSLETYRPGADEYRGGDGPVVVERLGNHHPIEQAFVDAVGQAGFARPKDYNGAEQEGVTAFDANLDHGFRSGTAAACIAPAARRPNVSVQTQAQVLRVLLDGHRAIGVEYLHKGEVNAAFTDGEVILSAGAFQSPQLLMLSGIGPADELR